MSGGGSSSPQMMFLPQTQQQSSTSTTQLPAWVNEASQSNYNEAAKIAPQLGQYYQGPMVAGMNQGQLNNIGSLNANVGSYDPAYQSAESTAANLQNYQPNQVQAQTLANTNLNPYMNPYTNDVVNSSLNVLRAADQTAHNQNADAAIGQRAFGGSRQAIQDAATDAQYGLQGAQLAAQLNSQNFGQAQQAAQADINNNLQSQQLNQSAGLQGANLGLNAASTLGGLASGQQQNYLNAVNAALSGNSMLQSQQQNEIQGAQQQLANQQAALVAPVNLKMSALGMSPYGQTVSSNGSSSGISAQAYQPQYSSPLMTGLGAGLGGLGALKSLGGLSGLQGLFALSDDDDKTNKQHLGTDPDTGLPMYAYDYKSDVEEARENGQPMPPKRVGPMASDMQRRDPKSVRKVGKHRVVNLGMGMRKHG